MQSKPTTRPADVERRTSHHFSTTPCAGAHTQSFIFSFFAFTLPRPTSCVFPVSYPRATPKDKLDILYNIRFLCIVYDITAVCASVQPPPACIHIPNFDLPAYMQSHYPIHILHVILQCGFVNITPVVSESRNPFRRVYIEVTPHPIGPELRISLVG